MLRLGLRLAVRRSAMRAASSSSLINGGIIEHEDHGSAHADQGAVLLMRGSNATKSQWVGPHRNVVDELVAAGFRPITFDARNMGRSQRFGDKGDVGRISNVGNMFTVEEMADDAMGVLDAYGVERAHGDVGDDELLPPGEGRARRRRGRVIEGVGGLLGEVCARAVESRARDPRVEADLAEAIPAIISFH